MKFLVAIAFLALAVAEAHHVPEHTLRGPRFKVGNTYKYDAVVNVTAGVLGLSSQVSASVLRADVKIQAKSETEYILKIENVRVSGSVTAIDNKYGEIRLQTDRALEDRLSSPIQFRLENGKVTRYTLSNKDDTESKKIKRSILRSLEMFVPENVIQDMENSQKSGDQPIMYNTTENTEYGFHISNYIITSSPDTEFPAETSVYNISRIDNCEGEWYPTYKLQHNFQKQGCPEVCKQTEEWRDNLYAAGCPSGFEPHHGPIKRSFSHKHSLSPVEDVLSPEIITTVEVHFANMYDQDMEVLIRYQLERTDVAKETAFEIESGQKSFEDLNTREIEMDEEEVDQHCGYKKSDEAIASVRKLLEEISTLIDEANPSAPIGEKVILLRDALATFEVKDFEKVAEYIPKLSNLQSASSSQTTMRQVWFELLPLIGTHDSVKFIVKYINTQLMTENNMLVWEAKEMLESLPLNVERPDEHTIKEIQKLLDNDSLLSKSTLLHSSVHLAVGRIIGEVCGDTLVVRREETEKRSWLRGFQRATPEEERGLPKCPEDKVERIIQKIAQKLRNTRRPEEMAVYVEALTHTGMEKALSEIEDYAHGTAENMEHFSPRHLDFMRSVVLHALHNIAGRHPGQVTEIALPVFLNQTETPKVRNAAFGVLMRCQPSLAILERIAVHSWFEKSREVGSFVTSTLESFGNSTLPCMQLLSHRIREVLPQVKRFSVGVDQAKNFMWTYFDALRQFGLEGRLEYTPNNESFIPSTMYHSLSYSMESLRDVVFQSSLNIEGLTQEKILEKLVKYLDMKNIEPISREREIFGEDKKGLYFLQPRTVEELRLVTYHRMFYKTSYYYLDAATLKSAIQEFSEVFEKYLRKSGSKYSGQLVKVFLPSTYHTVTVAKTLPYPVEFQMRQPIVLSLAIRTPESTRTNPTLRNFNLQLKPSIHMSKIITHQMKNLGDCKEVGVYHAQKIGMTYPFQIKYDGVNFPNITFKYKMPEMLKKVLYYSTESGTYAGKKDLETLPMSVENEPIRTLPAPFKFSKEVKLAGIPPFRIDLYTEDMNLFHQKIPRTPTEALHMAVRNILNAGWRYKSANITLLEDSSMWTRENEATFKIEYSRRHVARFARSLRNHHSRKNSRSPTWQRQTDEYRNPRQQDSRQSEDSAESSWWNSNVRQSEDSTESSWWNSNARQSEDATESSWWNSNSRQSEDATESSWWNSNSRQSDDATESSWWRRSSSKSEDQDWNTDELSTYDSPRLKQWEDDDWTTESSRLRQSEDDDWNTESSRLRQSEDDDWNTESSKFKQYDRDWTSKPSYSRNARQSDDNDWKTYSPRSSQSQDDDWSKYMEPTERESIQEFSQNAKALYNILNNLLPHITHTLNISVTAEPLYSAAYLLMEYNHTYDKNLHLLHVKGHSKRAKDTKHYEVNLGHAIGYFEKPDELRYGRDFGEQYAYFRTAINWPERGEPSCPWENTKIAINGHMNYTSNRYFLQQRFSQRVSNKYYLPETHEECLRDLRDGKPLSVDCVKAMREHSALNKIRMGVQWDERLPQKVKQVARVADVYLKHLFFEHLNLKAEENTPKRMDIVMEYIDKFVDEPLANWKIKKPSETVTLRQIPVANAQPFSSVYQMHEALLLKMTNNSYPARCVLSENHVTTYDLVTYPFRPENCHYVLSAHCTKNKNFAIILRGSKEIHIHVASTKIVLLPQSDTQSGYSVKYDGRDIKVEDPVIFNREHDIYAYLERYSSHSHIRVVAKRAGINVLYDGNTVKIQVSPRYKGELCGLCSEFDGEDLREFRGMDRCLYRDPVDFANSAMVQRSGSCDVKQPRDQRICEDPKFESWGFESTSSGEDEPSLQRNYIMVRANKACFSVRPVPACRPDQRPRKMESMRVGFHCLPQDDVTAKKLMEEAERRPLDELRRKSVDFVETVEVPTKCS